MNGEEEKKKAQGRLTPPRGDAHDDRQLPVSKVIHCRNVPVDATEQDLNNMARSFGRVTNVLILRGKNQAFIQMEDERAANALIQYYSAVQASLRGKSVYLQFSTRDEITNSSSDLPLVSEPQSSILLVTIQNVQFPITMDLLHRVFSKFGQILKIIIFNRNNNLQSFIQYSNIASAISARKELDGQNIYQSCCTLKIQFSQLSNLSVKYNNEKCRDFTNPNLPTDSAPLYPDPIPYWPQPHHSPHTRSHHHSRPQNGSAPSYVPNNNSNHILNNNNTFNSNQSLHGSHHGNQSNHSSRSSYHPHSNSLPLDNYNPYGKPLLQPLDCVLIASGIDSQTTLDELFTLFGVYGDVVRIKILYNKKDTALLQFSTPQQATTALLNLDGLPFRGKHLKVSYSKHQTISLPKSNEHSDSADYTKDYTNSPLHRYKVAGSKNFQHITAPSTVLHLSNLPLTINEEYLSDLFAGDSRSLLGVKFFQKDRRMALVAFESLEDAVEALVELHDYTIDDQNIRVSFSKSSLN